MSENASDGDTAAILREWLIHPENAGLLKPGATVRILTHRKLKRISLPAVAAR